MRTKRNKTEKRIRHYGKIVEVDGETWSFQRGKNGTVVRGPDGQTYYTKTPIVSDFHLKVLVEQNYFQKEKKS